ncbi:MAG: Guanylate kinase [Phycisphaerae bacterium]|nr:Guanylate kinase [Phycisphaerae bacterium]
MTEAKTKHGRLIVISGPSGVGKTTLCHRVLEEVPARMSVSATTRKPRANEREGADYYFMTPGEFEKHRAAGEFLEWATVFGNLYGTPLAPVRAAVEQGQVILLEIDVQGGIQVHQSAKSRFPDVLEIFIKPPSLDRWEESLRERLMKRGMDRPEEIARRVGEARAELEQAERSGAYKYFVVNDDLDTAVRELVGILRKEIDFND